jgi:hypothetical protein
MFLGQREGKTRERKKKEVIGGGGGALWTTHILIAL